MNKQNGQGSNGNKAIEKTNQKMFNVTHGDPSICWYVLHYTPPAEEKA
ncbi:hypothetical protein [Paenibacillus sp. FSL H7-0331]|nr:hypothetical protein [Paenibacillus sp. FSL H7-0331]